jgi:hypothetical protein
VELEMGEKLSDVYVPLFEDMSTRTDWIFAVGSEFGVDVSQYPLALVSGGRDLPPKTVKEVVELVKQSPRIYISNVILDPIYYESARGGDMLYVRSDWAIRRPKIKQHSFCKKEIQKLPEH